MFSITVSFTVSQSFLTLAILPFLCLCELSFQRSHRRLLTLRRLLIFLCVFASKAFFLSLVCLSVLWLGCPIRFYEGFRFSVPKFCHWWDVKPLGGISFIFRGFHFHLLLMDLKLTPYFFFFFFFSCRMARNYKEVSNS